MLLTMFIMMEICLRMRKRGSTAASSATPSKSKAFFGKELNNLSQPNPANCSPASSFAEYSYSTLSTDPSDSSNCTSSSSSSTSSRSPPCPTPTIKLGSYANSPLLSSPPAFSFPLSLLANNLYDNTFASLPLC